MKSSRLWKYSFGFILSLLFTSASSAEVLGSIPDRDPLVARVRVTFRSDLWTSPITTKNSPVRIYDLGASHPVIKGERWHTSLWFETEGVSSGRPDLVVGDRRTLIGSDLRTQEYGVGFYRQGEGQSRFTVSLANASDSDEPYRRGRDTGLEVRTVLALPIEGNFQWLLAADYSKNRGYLNGRPVPLFGVLYQPSTGFSATVGFPFLRLQWDRDSVWKSNFLMTPAGIHLEVIKVQSQKVSLRTLAGVATRSYLHFNRVEDDMRLMFQETYTSSGFRIALSERTSLELQVGGSIDRSFYEAKQVYQPAGQRTTLPADFFGQIRLDVEL